MAISDIISFGFGNGTFDPGVNKLPTLGYSIGAITTFAGVACFTSEAIVKPSFSAEAIVQPSFSAEAMVKPSFSAEDIDNC